MNSFKNLHRKASEIYLAVTEAENVDAEEMTRAMTEAIGIERQAREAATNVRQRVLARGFVRAAEDLIDVLQEFGK